MQGHTGVHKDGRPHAAHGAHTWLATESVGESDVGWPSRWLRAEPQQASGPERQAPPCMQCGHVGMHACTGLPPSHTAGRPIPQGRQAAPAVHGANLLEHVHTALAQLLGHQDGGLAVGGHGGHCGAGKSVGRAGSGGGGESQAAAAAANHNPSRGGPPLRPSCSHNCCQDVGRAPRLPHPAAACGWRRRRGMHGAVPRRCPQPAHRGPMGLA